MCCCHSQVRVGAGKGGLHAAPLPTLSEPHSPSLAGKSTHIWAHDLPGLFEQRRLQQQVPLSIPTNRLTQRIIPRWGPCGSLCRRGEKGEAEGRARVGIWPCLFLGLL